MRREPILLAIALSLAVIAAIAIASLISVAAMSPFSAYYLTLVLGPVVGSAVLVGLLFTVTFRLGTLRASPEQALAYLAQRLRAGRWRVSEGAGHLKVTLGPSAAIKIVARPAAEGAAIAYQADATTSAWGTVMTLLILLYSSPAAIPVIVYLFVRAWRFARAQVASFLPVDGVLPTPAAMDDVRASLVRALASAHGHAAEAYESKRQSYWNTQGVVFLVALFLWVLLFTASATLTVEPDWGRRVATAFLYSTVAGVAFGVAAGWMVRARHKPGVEQHRAWAERLHDALNREAASIPTESEAPSSFELLAETSRQVPAWLEVKRRVGISRDPGAFILLFIIGFWAVQLMWIGAGLATFDLRLGSLTLGGGVGATLAGIVLYRRWHLRSDEELARAREEWDRQFAAIRARMEEFLEGL